MTLADKAKRIVNGDDTTFEYNNEIFVVEQPATKSIVIDSKGNKAVSPKMYNMTDYQGTAAALQEYRQNLLFDKNGNLIDKFKKGKKIKSHIYKRGTKIEAMSYDKIINEIDNAHPTDATLISQTIDETTKKGKINPLQKMDLKKYWFDKFGETIDESIKNEKQHELEIAEHELTSAKNKIEKIDLNEIDKNELRRDYPKKNAQWIWDNWTHEQRSHFLYDHDLDSTSNWNKNYDELNDVIKNALKTHIKQGRYEHGTKIESQHEKLEYENVVNELRENASIAKIDVKPYGVEIQPYSPIDDAYMLPIKLTRHELLALYIESDKQFNHDNETIIGSIESMTKLLLKK